MYLVILGPVCPVDEVHEHARELALPARGCGGHEHGDDVLYRGLLRGCDGHVWGEVVWSRGQGPWNLTGPNKSRGDRRDRRWGRMGGSVSAEIEGAPGI